MTLQAESLALLSHSRDTVFHMPIKPRVTIYYTRCVLFSIVFLSNYSVVRIRVANIWNKYYSNYEKNDQKYYAVPNAVRIAYILR